MSEPDEAAVEAVAEVLAQNRNPFPLYPPTVMGLDRDEARLMLATPVVADWRRDAERLRNLAARFDDVVWLAKLAQGSSWPGEMAQQVQSAVYRVINEFGSDADRQVAAMLRGGGE